MGACNALISADEEASVPTLNRWERKRDCAPGLLTWCESWCRPAGSKSPKRGSLITLSQVTGLRV